MTRFSLPATVLLPLLAFTGACGDSAEPLVPTTLVVEETAVTLMGIGAASQIEVTVLDQNGDALPDVQATFESRDPNVAEVDASGVVTAVADGSTRIEVTAESARTEVTITVESELAEGEPVTGLTGVETSQTFFRIEVAAGEGDGRVLQVRTTDGQGDVELALRFGSPPTLSVTDCFGVLAGNFETCSIANPQAGTWHILLIGFADYEGVTLEASLEPLTPIEDGVPLAGLAASQFDFLYYEFDAPVAGSTSPARTPEESSIVLGQSPRPGSSLLDLERDRTRPPTSPARQVAGSTLTATTFGGTGDVDLIGTTAGQVNFTFTEENRPECASLFDGNGEQCVIENPPAGRWTFALFGFRTFSGVTFEVVLDP